MKQATVTTKGMESQKKSKSEKRSSLASNGKVNAAFLVPARRSEPKKIQQKSFLVLPSQCARRSQDI